MPPVYVSTKGTGPAVSFADAVLSGFPPDGGLYVPSYIPKSALFAARSRVGQRRARPAFRAKT